MVLPSRNPRAADLNANDHEEHPVAAILALRPEPATTEPALVPRPSAPGRLAFL
jgi:hypothetical protein